jgi:hypothetical protein
VLFAKYCHNRLISYVVVAVLLVVVGPVGLTTTNSTATAVVGLLMMGMRMSETR